MCLQALPVAFNLFDGFSYSRLSTIEKSISEIQTSSIQGLISEFTTLLNITTNLAEKVKELCAHNATLQDQLQKASSDLTAKSTLISSDCDAPVSTFKVADEIADRDRRKRNVIVYNLSEESNRAADKAKFIEVCKAITDNVISVVKLFCLGRKVDNKYRPLLVGLDSETDKQSILSAAPRLRSSNEFKQVYIVTDMAKVERERHKKVVAELKRR